MCYSILGGAHMRHKNPLVVILYIIGIISILYSFIGSTPMLSIAIGLSTIAVAETQSKES